MEHKNTGIGFSQKAILYNGEGKILTIRRSKTDPSRPLWWDLPGGILDYGENPKEAIVREIKEETGITVAEVSLLDITSWVDKNYTQAFWVTACYIAGPVSAPVTISWEHDDYQWVTPDEFCQLQVIDRHKEFIQKFAKQHGK